MTFLLFLYKENVIKNTNDGGTINFTGLSLTINLTGLSSPIIVHITPAININADIMDRAKNKFFFILVFFIKHFHHTPKLLFLLDFDFIS